MTVSRGVHESWFGQARTVGETSAGRSGTCEAGAGEAVGPLTYCQCCDGLKYSGEWIGLPGLTNAIDAAVFWFCRSSRGEASRDLLMGGAMANVSG